MSFRRQLKINNINCKQNKSPAKVKKKSVKKATSKTNSLLVQF